MPPELHGHRRLNDHRPCFIAEGVGPYGQRKQIGIFQLQVLHVGQPFLQEFGIGPLDVAGKMFQISEVVAPERIPEAQFLGKMKNRPQEVGEGIVFKQGRVPQEAKKEIPPVEQESPQPIELLRQRL